MVTYSIGLDMELEKAHKTFIQSLKTLDRSASTVIAYQKDLEQLIEYLSKQGLNNIAEVKLVHLKNFMESLAQKDYTAKSISRKTNATKTFFRYIQVEGHITSNPSDDLKHPKLESKAPRILSRLEYGGLRDAAKNDIRTYAIIEVLLQTGVRIDELSKINLEDFVIKDEKSGILVITEKRGHAKREIPLNHAVISAVKVYLNEERPKNVKSSYLFITKTGNPLLVRNIRSSITKYFAQAGIKNAKINDLRHTFVASNLAQGVNISYLSKIAGHKRISTTEKYLEYIERDNLSEKHELSIL
jgi:site-specific recombinase XerD